MLIKNAVFDRHDPLYEISKLFEASDRAGQVLWHPEVDTGEPAPDAVVFFQEHCRLAVTFVPSICAIEGKNWKAMDSSGGVDLKSPIDQAWRAGEAVRKTIKKCIGIGAYVISVVVFLNMAENDDIKASLGRSQVKLVWQIEELVERCAALPEEHQLQPQLNADFIEEETLGLAAGQGIASRSRRGSREACRPVRPVRPGPVGPRRGDARRPERRHQHLPARRREQPSI